MKTLLTIDWDYFVPEKIEWDLGHVESEFHIGTMWEIRAVSSDLLDIMKTSGEEEVFWSEIYSNFDLSDAKLFVTESHLSAFRLAVNYKLKKVINFDSHMDICYEDFVKFLNNDRVDCGNWCGNLLKSGKIKNATIILSKHSNERLEDVLEAKQYLNFRVLNWEDYKRRDKKRIKIDVIHICRSGAWTPPWLDDKFFKFVMKSGKIPSEIQLIDRQFNKEAILKAKTAYKEGLLNGIK